MATRRTKPRVETTEPSGRQARSAQHRGTVTQLENGNLEIASQMSELVPVAQFANVTIGPVLLRWQTPNPGIEKLGDVDWDSIADGDELTPEQQRIYDQIRGYLRATSKLVEHAIAEDRELVEESVRLHNEREAAEQEQAAKKARSSRPRRSSK